MEQPAIGGSFHIGASLTLECCSAVSDSLHHIHFVERCTTRIFGGDVNRQPLVECDLVAWVQVPRYVDVVPFRVVIRFMFADDMGPCCGLLEYPMVMFGHITVLYVVLHLGLEVGVKTRMAAECVDEILTSYRVKLLPSD